MDIWTGLVCLKANPRVKGFQRFGDDGKGAYVNVVAWVESIEAFEERVKRHVEGIDCILVDLEKVQLLETRMSEDDYPEELITMRETAARQTADTVFGTFHTWLQEDSN
jgi:hypothetical protein